jgi:lipopolysaccharide export system permease protein
MRILSRYIFRQTAGALVLILASLTGVVWIAVALRQLDLMTSQGQDALRFLAITALAIPTMLALIAPIALLIAAIHVLNKLNGDSELIVMTAGGMPVWALLKPLGALALLVALGVALVNHVIGPWSQHKLRELAALVRTDLMAQVIQPWRFASPEAKLTVHIRDRSPNGELLGLLMHDARDPKQIVTYLAERARIIKQEGAAYLRMDKGHIVRRLENDPYPQIIAFDRYVADLNQLEQHGEQVQIVRPRERFTSELLAPDPEDPVFKVAPGSFTSELHERFASPLYAFTFVLIVLALMGRAQTTRQNRMRAVIAAFGVALLCRVVGIATTNAAVVRPGISGLLYLVPAAAALVGVLATAWHLKPRPPSRLVRALERMADANRDRLLSARARLLPAAARRAET